MPTRAGTARPSVEIGSLLILIVIVIGVGVFGTPTGLLADTLLSPSEAREIAGAGDVDVIGADSIGPSSTMQANEGGSK